MSDSTMRAEGLGAPPVPRVLVVDDTPEDRLLAGAMIEKILGWKTSFAEDGWTALEAIEKDPPQLVLTDLQMPKTNGLRLVTSVRRKFPRVPVVLMTAHGSEEIALKALQAGAASYMPKRNLEADLADTLERVLSANREEERKYSLLGQLHQADFRFLLDNDRFLVPDLVAHLQPYLDRMGICDQTGRTRVGVALEEALLNAMYHGNLELSSDLRSDGEEPYHREAAVRRDKAPYRGRKVRFAVKLTSEEASFIIEDEGPGYNPGKLPDPTDAHNLEKSSGRGLLLIRTFMDKVSFNEKGNQITMVKCKDRPAAASANES